VRRLVGERPSRTRAFATACVVGAGAGVIVYKLLRSAPEESAA
jgi:hypothetical protein